MLVGWSLTFSLHLRLKFILSDEFKHLQCTFQKNLAKFLKSFMILKNLLDFFEMYIANVHGSLYFFRNYFCAGFYKTPCHQPTKMKVHCLGSERKWQSITLCILLYFHSSLWTFSWLLSLLHSMSWGKLNWQITLTKIRYIH